MKYRLINRVHGTEAWVESLDGTLPFKAARKTWKVLCGERLCHCGGPMSETEPPEDAEGNRYRIDFISSRGEIAGFRLVPEDTPPEIPG
ncbi:hypothetical protein [Magnetococcus sp. PR-3]|uniref:hypothetical protein n=1 Tax=Magnetococcus sp. PR-3 TaxID=3120355 RepID=UPI002FCE0FE2